MDVFIGELVNRFHDTVAKDARFSGLFILSDHGFTGIKKEFNLNTWLQQAGYQSVSPQGQLSLTKLCPETKAFALDPNRIYFNRKDRFPDGSVDPADVQALREAISRELHSVTFDGEPVVQSVLSCADIYTGPQTAHGPDLIVLTHYGYDTKAALGKETVFSETELQGMHTWDDAFFWAEEKIAEETNITDLAGLIEREMI